jgi:hypothetical protein
MLEANKISREEPVLTPELAEAAVAFLDRVTLQPQEIGTYMTVRRVLENMMPQQAPPATPIA